MMATVDQLKASLRLPDTGDVEWDNGTTVMLQGYLDAAQSYVQDAIGCDDDFTKDSKNSSLFDTATLAIAGAYFQNPMAVQAGSAPVVVDMVSNNIIGQLRARWEVSQQDGTTSESGTA